MPHNIFSKALNFQLDIKIQYFVLMKMCKNSNPQKKTFNENTDDILVR